MPHLKADPFDTSVISQHLYEGSPIRFRALPIDHDESELIGVHYGGEDFLLLLKKTPDAYMLKYEKISRPLDTSLLKQAINDVAKRLGLQVHASNLTLHEKRPKIASAYEKPIAFFEDLDDFGFPKVAVEVGFGSGRHLLYQAKRHPDTLFIGLEIHTPSAQQVLKQIALQGIENIWVVNYDARLFLEMLPSNLLERIYVHFPVPWDKKPHRRVIGKAFVDEALRTLKKEGVLELRTDSDNYFHYAIKTFSALNKARFTVRKNADIEVVSKYEARWRRMEKNIYDIHLFCEEVSEAKAKVGEFNFDIVKYEKGIEACLPKTAQRFGDLFFHIERIYRIENEEAVLVRLSLGSCDRPEHKYLYLGNRKIGFFPSDPVKSRSNYEAYRRLLTMLNERR